MWPRPRLWPVARFMDMSTFLILLPWYAARPAWNEAQGTSVIMQSGTLQHLRLKLMVTRRFCVGNASTVEASIFANSNKFHIPSDTRSD